MPRHIRPIRIEGNLAYITLTRGYEAVIDAADVPLVVKHNWYTENNRGGLIYARRCDNSGGRKGTMNLHRQIMQPAKGLMVDHINGDGLDNRRANLRVVNSSQNRMNQKKSLQNTSGYKGVYWNKRDCRWYARIKVNQKPIHLGIFQCPKDAYAAYCKASAELHGEYGRIA